MKVSQLFEASKETGPVDLKDAVKYFPNNFKKAVGTLSKEGRLTFGGKVVFDNAGEYGAALQKAIKEATKLASRELIDVHIDMDGSYSHSFDLSMVPEEVKEVFVGFDAKGDKLIIGFDAWLSEDLFNEKWDKEFEINFDEPFDNENPEHEKMFNAAWKTFSTEQMFYGLLVEVDANFHAVMDDSPMDGGFHKGFAKDMKTRKINSF